MVCRSDNTVGEGPIPSQQPPLRPPDPPAQDFAEDKPCGTGYISMIMVHTMYYDVSTRIYYVMYDHSERIYDDHSKLCMYRELAKYKSLLAKFENTAFASNLFLLLAKTTFCLPATFFCAR